MIMVDRQKRLAEPLNWGWRERAAVSGVLAVLIAAAVVLALVVHTKHRAGCLEVTFPSTLGAARIEQCGSHARALCAHPARLPQLRRQVEAACRRAGIA